MGPRMHLTEAAASLYHRPRWHVTIAAHDAAMIALTVAIAHGVTMDELLGPSRERRVAWPRQEAYRRVYDEVRPKLSPARVGLLFGRDRHTVIHGIREARRRLISAGVGVS